MWLSKLNKKGVFMKLFNLTSLVVFLLFTAQCSVAQDIWPQRPITLVVGFVPGGAADIAARTVSARMAEILGTTIIVDNRAGAATTMASSYVARSKPDGYTLYLGSVNLHGLDKILYPSITYDGNKDFTPITRWVSSPAIVVVRKGSGITSLADLVKKAKANPGSINVATAGKGSTIQLAMIDFMKTTGTVFTEIPYKGGSPATMSVLGGDTQVTFATPPTVLSLIRSDKLDALSVTSAQRSSIFPEIPSSVESGVNNYDYRFWYGLYAPANLPAGIANKLFLASVEALKDAEVQKKLNIAGMEAVPSTSQSEFKALIMIDGQKTEAFGRLIGKAD